MKETSKSLYFNNVEEFIDNEIFTLSFSKNIFETT